MKFTLALAAIAGLTLAPVAHAQVSCSDVRKLIAEAEDDFDALTGDEIDDDLYEGTYKFSGARDCTVDQEWDSIYSCGYQYQSYSEAYAGWSARLGEVSCCLSGWRAVDVTGD